MVTTRFELAVNGSAIALSTLRLRSADTPDAVNWSTCTRLNYEIDRSQLGPLSAMEASEDSSIVVDGLNTIGARVNTLTTVAARDGAGWSVRGRRRRQRRLWCWASPTPIPA